MITIQEAVRIAREFALYIGVSTNQGSARVEAVDFFDEDKENEWHITLGWVESATRETGGNNLFTSTTATIEALPRYYKKFIIDGTSGEVKSMEIKD
jgi:hypothetical protein